MSEPVRTADPAPRTALIARAAARPVPGGATAVLCGLALAFAGVHETRRPAGAALPAPAAAAASGPRVARIAKPACKPRRADTRVRSHKRSPRRCLVI
jgi:hypothetical protein